MSSIFLVSIPLFFNAQPGEIDAQKAIRSATSIADYRTRLVKGCQFFVCSIGTEKTSDGLKTLSSRKKQISFAPSRYVVESGENDEKNPWPTEAQGFNEQYGFRLRNLRKEPLWVVTDLFINDPLRILLQGRA